MALLHNVRLHAGSSMVIVHAERAPDGSWSVTVRDDGRGYDPETVTYGVGIREQLIDQLAAHGVAVDITSSVGAGTRTVLTGRVDPGSSE